MNESISKVPSLSRDCMQILNLNKWNTKIKEKSDANASDANPDFGFLL